MIGLSGKGKNMPRVMQLSIARYDRNLPQDNEPLEFLVSIHEEGSGVTWQENVTVDPESERALMEMVHSLYLWTTRLPGGPTNPAEAWQVVRRLGAKIFDSFIGLPGEEVLGAVAPTAILLSVDETIMGLPWELMGPSGLPLSQRYPFGRLVTTRLPPPKGRDPTEEDDRLRILAVVNPTPDLGAGEQQIAVLKGLAGTSSGHRVEVDVLPGERASRREFQETVATNDYDIVHFAGHGSFDQSQPGASSLMFSDGVLTADEVHDLEWGKPPYMVFNGACESGRAATGRRLVSGGECNGLAAAFISGGAMAYAGYYWPVTKTGAGQFTQRFYENLLLYENVGMAFLVARSKTANGLFNTQGDLTGFNAILYGDAASEHRQDLFIKK